MIESRLNLFQSHADELYWDNNFLGLPLFKGDIVLLLNQQFQTNLQKKNSVLIWSLLLLYSNINSFLYLNINKICFHAY